MLIISSILFTSFLLGSIVSFSCISISSLAIPQSTMITRVMFSGLVLTIISGISTFIINYLDPFLLNNIQSHFSTESSSPIEAKFNTKEDETSDENIHSTSKNINKKSTNIIKRDEQSEIQDLVIDYPEVSKGVIKKDGKLIVDGYHFEDNPKLMAETVHDVLERDKYEDEELL